MFRPWIFSETRLFFQNPTKIVYVGHNRQGACANVSAFCLLLRRPPKSRIQHTPFATQLATSWYMDFVTPVLQVLNGTNSMTNIFDLKFIIPAFVDIFTVPEKLQRNDYLLAVALLASASNYGTNLDYTLKNDFTGLPYNQYRVDTRIREELLWASVLRTTINVSMCTMRFTP